MPHTVLWQLSDWQFAFDSIELAAQLVDGAPAAIATELRAREKGAGHHPRRAAVAADSICDAARHRHAGGYVGGAA
jgi:hypothetical protein